MSAGRSAAIAEAVLALKSLGRIAIPSGQCFRELALGQLKAASAEAVWRPGFPENYNMVRILSNINYIIIDQINS
jgi:hypothetical protein